MNAVVIGAHPDDAEVFAGGVSVKWARLGHHVLFVSMTNGDIGHHAMAGGPLAQRRAEEAAVSAQRAGVKHMVLDCHDGELEPTLAARKRVVGIIRDFEADVVLTHRPNDYHPDHRYASVIVQDAAFMVTVPHFCPSVPALRKNPLFLYLFDAFKKPTPFRADIAVDVSEVMNVKWSMLDAMESQFYEWLPWLDGILDSVPADRARRFPWLEKTWGPFFAESTQTARATLEKWYGKKAAAKARFVETFEICEYGLQPSEEDIRRLFPFFPGTGVGPK